MRRGCEFPGCLSSAEHDSYDTHFRCACGWVGYVHSRHVSCLCAVRRRGGQRLTDAQAKRFHRIVARQRLRRPLLRVVA